MRHPALLSLLVVLCAACEPPRRPPPPRPADPGGVTGCRSLQMADGLMYSCAYFQVFDGEVAAGSTMKEIETQLVGHARKIGKTPTAQPRTVTGATDALLVSYTQDERHSFDLVATRPQGVITRLLTCHVTWFREVERTSALENSCTQMMTTLLGRVPAGKKLSPECQRATSHLYALNKRSDADDSPPDLKEVSDFANRCDEKVAACGLAAKTYVEATLCRS